VDDAGLVRRCERVSDLDADLKGLVERELAAGEAVREGLPVQILHHEVIGAVLLTDVVECADVRVGQRRDCTRFTLEPLPGGRVVGQLRREHLEGDGAVQARISRTVDLPHAARTSRADDFVGAKPSTRLKGHRCARHYTWLGAVA
jgi:hypothetical protein